MSADVEAVIRSLARYTAIGDPIDMSDARKTIKLMSEESGDSEVVDALWVLSKRLLRDSIDVEDEDRERPPSRSLPTLLRDFVIEGCRRALRHEIVRCHQQREQRWGEWHTTAKFIAEIAGTSAAQEFNDAVEYARTYTVRIQRIGAGQC